MHSNSGTDNEEVMNVDTRVRTVDGHIVIEDMPIGEPYAIYDLSGQILKVGEADGSTIYFQPNASSNYVVRYGHSVQIIGKKVF